MDDRGKRELVERLVKSGPDGEARHSRRWFNRVLLLPFAAGAGLAVATASRGAPIVVPAYPNCTGNNQCNGAQNTCATNVCSSNVCDVNICSVSNTCTVNTCSGTSNQCLGATNSETCTGTTNSCNALNNCTGINTSNIESCTNGDTCYVNTCGINACVNANTCSYDDSCAVNTCGTDTDCGTWDYSCWKNEEKPVPLPPVVPVAP